MSARDQEQSGELRAALACVKRLREGWVVYDESAETWEWCNSHDHVALTVAEQAVMSYPIDRGES